jgi:crotonobetainyl-CoA:carnitine CoA-transferase CaiB-like acyl-CoA transferase
MTREGANAGALSGVRVLDLTDERGIYGAKLLADLGADVVRPEPPGGDPLRGRGPFAGGESLYWAFFASSRRSVTVDEPAQLRRIAAWADIALVCEGSAPSPSPASDWGSGIDIDAALRAKPSLVVVRVTSFGTEGPWKDYVAPDLVAAALGGFAATTGDADTQPLKGFGELNFTTSGTYAAIGALAALRHARETGEGQVVDVSVHEAIASCLEQVFMWYWYEGRLGPMQKAKVLPRRGSVHWSDTYEVMKARTGSIMVTPMPDVQQQIAWLVEEDAHGELLNPELAEPRNFARMAQTLMQTLRDWVATKDAEPLFFEAQERHRPYGWVLPIDQVAENPHLAARDWWTTYRIGEQSVRGPGAPYRFSETPWRAGEQPAAGADTDAVLREIGWGD